MWKEVTIVMLPFNNEVNKLWQGQIAMHHPGHKLFILDEDTFSRDDLICDPHHLYFVSDEEIKEGNWYFSKIHNKIFQSVHTDQYFENEFKVIASTDTSLNLPQPSKEWIEYFVSEWNKGNKIEKVMVEYEQEGYIIHKSFPANVSPRFYLKINSDNTINIKPIKDSWSREEVRILLADFALEHGTPSNRSAQTKWIEEKLK